MCSLVFFRALVSFRCVCGESYDVRNRIGTRFTEHLVGVQCRQVTSEGHAFTCFLCRRYYSTQILFSFLRLKCRKQILHNHNHLCQHGVFFTQTILCKTCPDRPFWIFLSRFSSPPRLYTPLHSSLSIIMFSHSFLDILHRCHKTSCPGKFPRP